MDESESPEYLVLAGYFLPPEKWSLFIEDWKGVLSQHPKIEYFHAVESRHRRRKGRRLSEVIRKHQPLGLATYIRKADWEKVLLPQVRQGFQNPYYALFSVVIKELFGESVITGMDTQATFVFDEKTEIAKNAIEIYEHLRQYLFALPALHKLFGDKISFDDDRKTIPLQAADLLAWYQRRCLAEPNKDHSEFSALDSTVQYKIELNQEYLRAMIPNANE